MAETCTCTSAIVELHDFFSAWYRGEPQVEMVTMEEALAPGFRLITPKASLLDRTAIIDATHKQRGAYPNARIEIRPVHCTTVRGLHLATYEEWQYDDVERPARLSTAVLSTTDDAWRWHVVHETWLDQGPSDT